MDNQADLFDTSELDELQLQVQQNYQEIVKKNLYVFVEESADDDVSQISEEVVTKGRIESDLFDVAEIDKINADIEAEKLEKAVKEAYKTMDLPYFENPRTDTEKLLNYQFEYIKNGNPAAYAKLLDLAFQVCKNLVRWYLKTHKDMYLDEIGQDEKASIAMEYVIRRYKYNIGWYVRENYVGALKGGVLHAMTYENTTDKNTIYVENPRSERTKNK